MLTPSTPVEPNLEPAMSSRVPPERTTADVHEPVVAFLVGMRINRLRSPRGWLPVAGAMCPMLLELFADRSLGMLGARTFLSGRTIMVVSYWQSFEALEAYAGAANAKHRPAWTAFYQRSRKASGAVGIFHETFIVGPGTAESLYVDVPADFGLGGAVGRVPVTGSLQSARQRRDRDAVAA
jgi:hypothetical protein